MKILKTIGFWFIQATWGFPQFALGFLGFLILFPFAEHFVYRGAVYTVKKGNWGGLSMGVFIFVSEACGDHSYAKHLITHERSHSTQSLILGVFWLFVIGLPSLCWAGFIQNLVNKKRKKKELPLRNYYWFFTEKNAEWIADKCFR